MSNQPFPGDTMNSGGPLGPPRRSVPIWLWIVGAIGVVALLPFCCCGGLLAWSSTFTDFTLSNGEHLGGSPMNIKFDYELRGDDRGMPKAYSIVVRSADGTTRDRPIGGGFINRRGTFTFNAFDVGQSKLRGPVKVWIESSDAFGRSTATASNTLTIYPKS